jgi:hypothetical protein
MQIFLRFCDGSATDRQARRERTARAGPICYMPGPFAAFAAATAGAYAPAGMDGFDVELLLALPGGFGWGGFLLGFALGMLAFRRRIVGGIVGLAVWSALYVLSRWLYW